MGKRQPYSRLYMPHCLTRDNMANLERCFVNYE
jgi:hypothetical protein